MMMDMRTKPLAVVIQEHAQHLMAIPGVVGLSQGLLHGKSCLQILVEEHRPPPQHRLPRMVEGYPVVIKATGSIRPVEGV
jgi:hypothetical protein